MKIIVWALLLIFTISIVPTVHAEELEIFTNRAAYTDGEPLFVYGKAISNENLIIRLLDIIALESVILIACKIPNIT